MYRLHRTVVLLGPAFFWQKWKYTVIFAVDTYVRMVLCFQQHKGIHLNKPRAKSPLLPQCLREKRWDTLPNIWSVQMQINYFVYGFEPTELLFGTELALIVDTIRTCVSFEASAVVTSQLGFLLEFRLESLWRKTFSGPFGVDFLRRQCYYKFAFKKNINRKRWLYETLQDYD